MRILSIDVVSPPTPVLLHGVLIGALFALPFAVLAALNYLPATLAAMYAAGAISGVLANLHGISIKRQGWRAVVVNFLFGLPLMVAVYLCMTYLG